MHPLYHPTIRGVENKTADKNKMAAQMKIYFHRI